MEKASKPTDTGWKKVKQKVSSVWKLVRCPFSFLNWLLKHRKSIILVGVFAIALAMMFGASFRLRGAELLTVLMVAGILIISAFIKMLYDFVQAITRRDLESETLKRENVKLKEKLQEEHGRMISKIKTILELNVLEVECEVMKFFDRYFDRDNKEIGESLLEQRGPGPRKPVKRFLGAVTSKFNAKYGIDIQKVQVKRDDRARAIYVAGAEPHFTGPGQSGFQTRWAGSVGLHYWWGNWSIDEASQKLESECQEKYRVAVEESLKNGPEQLEWVKGPLKKNIKLLLKEMIAPPGYSVELVENADKGFTPLFDYMRILGLEGPDQLLLP